MTGVWPVTGLTVPQVARPPDRAIAELAKTQHAVVALWQLLALGLSASGVRKRVARGSLHGLHRGVYAVGHPIVGLKGRWMAAVLACGLGAVLSHRDAGALRGLRESARALIDVTVPHRRGRTRRGIDVHSGATLRPQDVTVVDGIPCTSVARTLLDLADVLHPQALEKAVHQAEILRVFDGRQVEELLRRSPGRCSTLLRRVIAEGDFDGPGSRSRLEDGFLAFCERNGFPRPKMNADAETPDGPREVDFMWRPQRLVVESDSRRFHDTWRVRENDYDKSLLLDAGGWTCLRATWRQITRDDPRLVGAIRRRVG